MFSNVQNRQDADRNQEIRLCCLRSKVILPHVQSAELTQNSLVNPFLQVLGFQTLNMSYKNPVLKTEKLTLAFPVHPSQEQEPLLLVECRHHQESLISLSTSVIKRNRRVRARYGVLTNGLDYRFYQFNGPASKKKPVPLFKFRINHTRISTIVQLLHEYLDLQVSEPVF